MMWDLDNAFTKRANMVAYSNPQTQIGAIVADNVAPTVTSTNEGAGYLRGSAQTAALHLCGRGPRRRHLHEPDERALTRPRSAPHTYTVTATDKAGNTTTTTVNYVVNSIATDPPVGGTVAPTLALTMAAPRRFDAFTPGIAKDYVASTTATVISTAGDARDLGRRPECHQYRQARQRVVRAGPDAAGRHGRRVRGDPATVKTYSGPTSNEVVTIGFKQSIGVNEPLRTGMYGKTLTFTLSTTNP